MIALPRCARARSRPPCAPSASRLRSSPNDPAAPFVEHTRKNFPDARATFVVAGADALPRRDSGFDALNFLPDATQAVPSMRERVRRGGTVAAYVWDYADGMEFLRFFWDEAVASNPDAAALDEGRRFPLCQAAALASVFRAAGLAQVETHPLEIPTAFATFDDYWTPFLRGTGPAPSYVASLDQAGLQSLRERLRQRLPAQADGRIHLRARAWAVRGTAS